MSKHTQSLAALAREAERLLRDSALGDLETAVTQAVEALGAKAEIVQTDDNSVTFGILFRDQPFSLMLNRTP